MLVFVLLSVPVLALAQRPPQPIAQREAISKLDFLTGHWKGTAWFDTGQGRKIETKGEEWVKPMLEGVTVLVEGLHRAVMPGSDEPVVIHHALGVLSYDEAAGHYRFKTYLANGHEGDFTATIEDGVLVWGGDFGRQGQIRYTVQLNDDGEWFEIGERLGEDETWHQFFEMTLARVVDAEMP